MKEVRQTTRGKETTRGISIWCLGTALVTSSTCLSTMRDQRTARNTVRPTTCAFEVNIFNQINPSQPNARPVETGWSPTINGRALNERLTTCPANIHTTRITRLFGLGAPTFPLFFFTPRLSQPPFFSTASNRNRRRHSAQLKWPSITITLEYGKSSLLLESARLIRLTHRPCSHPLFGQITTPIGSTAM